MVKEAPRKGSLNSILGPTLPTAYNPHRLSPPSSVLTPISKIELLQCQNPTGNPLRLHLPPLATTTASSSSSAHEPTPPPIASTSSLLPPKPSFLPQKPVAALEHAATGNGAGGEGYYGRGDGGYNNNQNQKRPLSATEYDQQQSPDRKFRRSATDVLHVAGHYNARPNFDVNRRRQSPIYGLKAFNNWIKVVLIAKFARRETDYTVPKVRVLELGCGKGGDLQKWGKAGTEEYVGFDLAAISVEDAKERYRKSRAPVSERFPAAFFALDCFERSISEILESNGTPPRPFDVVSLQFCMHYAFETEAKVQKMLENVVRYLRTGGVFFGTIPDARNLLARLETLGEDEFKFGNEVYNVKFDEKDMTPRYGHRYTFFLQDAVEDVPEYVVYWDQFVELAQSYGLRLVYYADFQEIFVEEGQDPHFADLLSKMGVVDPTSGETEMTSDQWEAANLYIGFAFVRED